VWVGYSYCCFDLTRRGKVRRKGFSRTGKQENGRLYAREQSRDGSVQMRGVEGAKKDRKKGEKRGLRKKAATWKAKLGDRSWHGGNVKKRTTVGDFRGERVGKQETKRQLFRGQE